MASFLSWGGKGEARPPHLREGKKKKNPSSWLILELATRRRSGFPRGEDGGADPGEKKDLDAMLVEEKKKERQRP